MKTGNIVPEEKDVDYYRHQRQEMLRFIPPVAHTILEIGCGAGDFGALLKRDRKAEVWGIELVPAAAEKAAQKLDRVMAGNLETDDIQLPGGYFDCIVCNDVLEHLVDPWQVLQKMRDNLCPDGVVVASIPNVRFYGHMKNLLLNKEWEYTDEGLMDRTHLRFFTINSIRKMFESCGYKIISLEGVTTCKLSLKFRVLNMLLFNSLDDMRMSQIACVAQKI